MKFKRKQLKPRLGFPMNIGEEELKRYQNRLEELVEERTAELKDANKQLLQEINEHRQAEEELKRYQNRLEELVEERTIGLKESNERLRQEMFTRRQVVLKLKQHKKLLEVSQRELKDFSRKILSIREEEKKSLSISLHDEVGSMAINLSSNLSSIKNAIKDNSLKQALKTVAKNKLILKNEVAKLKRIARDLRPPDLDIIGLPGALREYFLNITAQEEIKIDFSVEMEKEIKNDNMTIVLFRIVQESLNNIIKHANANKVKVTLKSWGNNVKLSVSDNGVGFDKEKSLGKIKIQMGLRGMREMAESLKGKIIIKSAPGKGTKIQVNLPIPEENIT